MISGTFRTPQNADFSWSQQFGADFTGSTFRMQIKSAAGAVVADLQTGAGIECDDAPKSTLTLYLAQTDVPPVGEYTFDILQFTGPLIDALIGGSFVVFAGVTVPTAP